VLDIVESLRPVLVPGRLHRLPRHTRRLPLPQILKTRLDLPDLFFVANPGERRQTP
jgi:hypothetical protein